MRCNKVSNSINKLWERGILFRNIFEWLVTTVHSVSYLGGNWYLECIVSFLSMWKLPKDSIYNLQRVISACCMCSEQVTMWWWRSIFFYMPPQTGRGEGLWPSLDREPQTGNMEELWWKCWRLDFLMKWIEWPTILRPSSPEQNDNQCQYVCMSMKHRIDDAAN